MLSEVCSNVSVEPHLQPLSGETLRYQTANSDPNARLDIAAYRHHEKEKRHQYMNSMCMMLSMAILLL